MFTLDDFFKIFTYLETGDPADLDVVTRILADSERSTSSNLFTNKLDLNVFATNDYKLVRKFLVDWYASHRTLITTQKTVGDVFSLPKEHLDELMRSFGFNVGLSDMTTINEQTLMMDLVNLYKIKGTPSCLAKVLSYFNLNRIDVVEYWLKLNSGGELVFSPDVVIQNNALGVKLPGVDLNFNLVESIDPHWLLQKNEIMELFNDGDISFPIKSPYIGIRPLYFIDYEILLVVTILSKKVYNEYISWSHGFPLPTDEVRITVVNNFYSLLELYLICDYVINLYSTDNHLPPRNFFRYNGTYDVDSEVNLIIDQYKSYLIRPKTREERNSKMIEFFNLFSVDKSLTFLPNYSSSGDLLNTINPTLKNKIDFLIDSGKKQIVLYKSIKDLSEWITYHISADYSNFSTFGLGSDSIDFLISVVNFFKPYRARLLTLDSGLIMKNPLADSLIMDDYNKFSINLEEIAIDFETANSLPGVTEIPTFGYITSDTPDSLTRQIKDLYIDQLGNLQCIYNDSTSDTTVFITSTPPIGCYRINNIYLKLETYGSQDLPKLVVDYGDVPEISVYPTDIQSIPTTGYVIESLHMSMEFPYHNDERGLVIRYLPVYYDHLHSNKRGSYSREYFDQGSFFDIGVSIDSEVGKYTAADSTSVVIISFPVEIDIQDRVNEVMNFHPYVDSTACTYCEWDTNIYDEVVVVRTSGGWTDFDQNGVFDTQFVNDVCEITVIDL